MAEAVGLSLAILGLAGNLKGCLDMFAYFSSARDFGRDYSTLASKFDIEKALLLQWAERVRILRTDYDPRLDDETTLELVSGILANIQRLLADGAELQRKYGLKSVNVSPDGPQGLLGDGSATRRPEDVLISNSMMRRFTEDFQSLCIRTKPSQNTTSTKRKFLWVVGQKEKFEKLVDDLAHFVSKLNQIVPDRGVPSSMGEFGDGLAQKLYQLMTDSSRRVFHMAAVPEDSPGNTSPQVAQLAQLRMARDAARQDQTSSILSDVADRILIQKSESIIIDAIWFRSLQARRDSIEPAHLKTLAWVLEPTQDTGEWDNLATWLKSDIGVYWVSGKAGSGKSTLMKHVHNHPTTLDLLERWASGDSLLVGSFFFWGLGSSEQKSHRGLYRSLFHHIIERHPFLVPKLFPEIWREVYVKNERNLNDLVPTDADLKGAFTALPTILAEHGIKICVFIDGLDEFEGNLRVAIQIILELGQTPNIKVVVSSRPEPACVSAFSTLKKLRLQDLNRRDIQEYVDSEVGANPYMQELRKDDDAGCARLLEDLADRASGVFLWIILACRSLLDGFDSTDSLCEPRQRLEELPRKLADMFQHMLNKVPTRYHEQTAKLLKLAERCQVAPWHAEDPHRDGMPALTLSIMEHAGFRPESASSGYMRISKKKTACERIEGRVRSRTGGLLEFVTLDSLSPLYAQRDLETLPIGDREPARKKINSIVRFMHRTVFEFLHDSTVWETLNALQLATKGGFDPESVLAAMSIGRVHFTCEDGWRSLVVEQMLFFFREIDQLSFPQATTKNIYRLFDLAKKWMGPNQHNFLFWSPNSPSIPASVLTFAAELGMTEFLKRNLHNQGQSSVQQGHNVRPPLLFCALIQPMVAHHSTIIDTHPGTLVPPSSRTASYLLEQSYHPMQQVSTNFFEDHKTTWEAWLDRLAERADIRSSEESWEITMKMMDYGADPRVMREHKSNVVRSILDLLVQYEDKYTGERASEECHRLRELLDEWRSGGRSYASEGEESGGETDEWGDQGIITLGMIKRRWSEDDGPDSKRRRYNDDEDVKEEGEDEDEYDYTNGENVDNDYLDDDDAGEGDGFEDNLELYLQLY